MKAQDLSNGQETVKGRFGTFGGVFTPAVLTILGIILFLRIGWVVGQTGLVGALFIIALANTISFITGLSISSIATNMHVRTGGAYYMIARTLGLEIGGAIGIPLYMSQAVSVAFYIIGFTEALTSTFPALEPRLLSTLIALLFGYLAYVGADFAIKIQYVILLLLGLALTSFFTGSWGAWVTPTLLAPPEADAAFWHVFAIFFPAVTGIMVGVSMSGDLKDPGRSIPRGTISAITITGIIYLAAAVWLSTHATTAELLGENMIMQKIARWPTLILLGVWASTLSSALGSILAAPRTLQALAFDRAVPHVLGSRMGSPTEPRLAVILTTAIAVCVIWMGNLDFVAPIITMFFLNTYGMVNLMAGLERLVGNPSFRPGFKVPGIVSLLGAVGCYGAMFLINTPATVAAIIVSYGVFALLERRALQQSWGDIRSGFWFAIARFGLVRLEAFPRHVKNWRPNIVVFTSIVHNREQLMEMGTWLIHGHGILSFYHLLVGDVDELAAKGLRSTSAKHLQKFIDEHGVAAFAECSIVEDMYSGIFDTMQMHGIAGLEPNTALLGWSSQPEDNPAQLLIAHRLMALGKSTLFLKFEPECSFGRRKRIDCWWRGRDRNAELMLLLAHIIRSSPAWEDAEIRVLRLVASEEARQGARESIAAFLKNVRVDAEAVVLVHEDREQPFTDVLENTSRESDLVFLGLQAPEPGNLESLAGQMRRVLMVTPTTIMVRSGEREDILTVESAP